MDTVTEIHKLILRTCKEAYNEGKEHILDVEKMHQRFEDTRIYAVIMKEYYEREL